MKKVMLHTRDGRDVIEVMIPPFQIMPEGIIWGSRTFFLRPDGEYYEGLMYPITYVYGTMGEIIPHLDPSHYPYLEGTVVYARSVDGKEGIQAG